MTLGRPRLYLLDVEGTTSPVSLVYEQLFPYARKHLKAFLIEHGGELEIEADLALLAAENGVEAAEDVPRFAVGDGPDQAEAYLLWLMDRDRKSTALKSLQGRIWKSGYLAGELVGTVFDDVPAALARWSRRSCFFATPVWGILRLIFLAILTRGLGQRLLRKATGRSQPRWVSRRTRSFSSLICCGNWNRLARPVA